VHLWILIHLSHFELPPALAGGINFKDKKGFSQKPRVFWLKPFNIDSFTSS
jgi:hypothetical protein